MPSNGVAGPVTRRRGHALQSWLGLLVAAGFLWWFLRDLDLGTVVDRIRTVRPAYFIAAVAFSLAGFVVRSLRWRYLLASLRWVRLSSAVSAVFIGWAITAILPGRLGGKTFGQAPSLAPSSSLDWSM
jgi:uncharacterized membrane protein YbhN (UPF0104 family)